MEDNTTPLRSNHPVLSALNEQIDQLLGQIAKLQADYASLDSRYAKEIMARQTYAESLKETFVSAIQSGYDKETIVHLAYELDVELTERKTYTVQVEFQVEAIVEIGEDLEAYELDFTVEGSNIEDYSFEVSGIDEN